MAPEVILQKDHDSSADIWSLGITAIQLLTGKLPRSDLHPLKVIWMTPREPAPKLEGKFGSATADFVAVCLDKNPQGVGTGCALPLLTVYQRPAASDLLKKHKYIKGVKKTNKLVDVVKTHAAWREDNEFSSGSSDEARYRLNRVC